MAGGRIRQPQSLLGSTRSLDIHFQWVTPNSLGAKMFSPRKHRGLFHSVVSYMHEFISLDTINRSSAPNIRSLSVDLLCHEPAVALPHLAKHM